MSLPNAITLLRILGTPVLAFLAWRGDATAFAWLFAILYLTDWVDGKLAILLDRRTELGARLDSAADVAMYAALILGAYWLRWDVVREEALWLVAWLASWAVAMAYGKVKFGRFPSYHTRSAKTCWLLAGIAAVSLFAGGPPWILRVACGVVVLANVESVLITRTLPEWRADVTSIFHARAGLHGAREGETGRPR